MIFEQPQLGDFGFNPLSSVKKAVKKTARVTGNVVKTSASATKKGVVTSARAVGTGAKATGHVVKKYGVKAAVIAAFPAVVLTKAIAAPALRAATTPIRRKIDVLKDRRAKKIAWDKRKSKEPTQAERNEARAWAKNYLKHSKPPFGLMLSALAGSPSSSLGDSEPYVAVLGEPVSATIIASIPVLLALITAILNKASSSGEAPGELEQVPGGVGPDGLPLNMDAGMDQGVSDMAPVQAAAEEMQAAASEAQSQVENGGPGGEMSAIPGVKRSHLMLGGIVVAGLLAVVLITRKKG
jgi:hypothetical protein